MQRGSEQFSEPFLLTLLELSNIIQLLELNNRKGVK